ncbi:MAG: FHA domain-containing protein [Gammaproteobacteria bacterium]
MKRAPFLRLSEPTEIFHSDQSALLHAHLAAATTRADSLVVILGTDGIGKTTLLNEYIAGLDDDLCYATFDETCVEGIQFYRSFLEQIGLGEIVGTLHELQHITSEYLIHRSKNGGHSLIFVDNAHRVRPAVLEQLRWIADVKIDLVRAFSMVLAGNLSFQRIIDSPAMRSLKFCYQTCFHIRAFSEAETDDYIRHRLNLAGAVDAVKFSGESLALIHRFTGGNPGMIHALCNAVLAESCAQGTRVVSEQRIRSVAEARGMLPHVVPLKGKGRRKNDPEPVPLAADANSSERIMGRQPDAALQAGDSRRASPLHDIEIKELLVRITELSSQLERKAAEEKRRALMDAKKHDKDVGELRLQLAAQTELAAKLSRTMDDRTRDIGRLNAALLDSERLRQEAGRARQSLAEALDALRGKLDASNQEVEKLTARQEKCDRQIDGLTQALTEEKATLAERDATIEALAAELDNRISSRPEAVIADLRAQVAAQSTELHGLLTTVASSAAEIAALKETRSGARRAPLDERVPRESIGDPGKQRRSTRRAKALRGMTRRRSEVAAPPAGPDPCIAGTSETETLLPDQMTRVPAGERTMVTAEGNATTLELFLDGKPWKVMGLAGRPPRMMIGRADDCDIRLDSKYVSRHHAIMVNREGHVAIEDLRSSNGIFVNAKKVDHADLRPGDTVAIGNFWLRLKRS